MPDIPDLRWGRQCLPVRTGKVGRMPVKPPAPGLTGKGRYDPPQEASAHRGRRDVAGECLLFGPHIAALPMSAAGGLRSEGGDRMPRVLNESLIYEILSVVEEIPEGRVASYGQIAALIGREQNSRLVGRVLSMAAHYGTYPCHRVVNHAGRLAPFFPEQRELLQREGVELKENGCVDMLRYGWKC